MKTEKKTLSHRIAKGIESPIKEYKNYMENFWRKGHIKMKKITKNVNIYLEKLKIIQKSFTFKISWEKMRAILRITGQFKIQKDYFSSCLIVNKSEVTSNKISVEKFNKFFFGTGPTFTIKISKNKNHFIRYLSTINTILDEWPLTEDKFKNAFFHWRVTKVQVLMISVEMLTNKCMI